ncbi:MAG: cytidylate kinase family protein [Candidatus Caldarchaeum sp.]|nr:cytidylate kinase family protein [Candidatus Caldarchaeum sp.]
MVSKKVICIAGFAAVGKSTVGKIVARRLGLKYVSGGDALKAVAKDMGFAPTGSGWWETPKGMEFLALRSRDPSFDRKVDKKLIEICRKGGVVVDSWVMPWLYKGKGFKVWMTADRMTRARRMAERSGITVRKASKLLKTRDQKSSRIYQKLYGIKIGKDFTPFHLIIDTTRMKPEQVADIISETAKNFFKTSTQKPRRR